MHHAIVLAATFSRHQICYLAQIRETARLRDAGNGVEPAI